MLVSYLISHVGLLVHVGSEVNKLKAEIAQKDEEIKELEATVEDYEDKITFYLSKVKKLEPKLEDAEDQLAQWKKNANIPELVKRGKITFVKFDLKRFNVKLEYDEYGDCSNYKETYVFQQNWVFIGSLGDPETWKGTPINVVVKENKGTADSKGLFGTLIDMNVMQEILY